MRLLGLCSAVLIAVNASPSMADPWENASSFWAHNGSIVGLEAQGSHRRFVYAVPRPGMQAAGASEGSLLFDGESSGRSYSGVAYIFSGQCGPTPYAVHGPIVDNGQRIVMQGRAPRVAWNCQTTGYFNDTLVFTLTNDPRIDQ